MGKYVFAVLTVFAIEFALFVFGGQAASNTSIFNLLFNPSTILSNPLYLLIGITLVAFAASTIIPGNFYQINIYALYAGIVIVLISFSISISHFYVFIFGELQSTLTTEMARIITILITAPLLAFYLMSSVEWIRSNQ